MHNLIKAAPEFDGSGDVEFWMNEMQLYLDRHEVHDRKSQINVYIGALSGTAREWFGSLSSFDVDKKDLGEVRRAIASRYGKSFMQKLRAFENLKQAAGEKLDTYADRLRKASYGLNKNPGEIIYKFYRSINNSSTVYDFVINLPCDSLQQAVEYVERHSKSSSSQDKSQIKCSFCKKLGHTSKRVARRTRAPPKGPKRWTRWKKRRMLMCRTARMVVAGVKLRSRTSTASPKVISKER